jgi:alanyl-tRNA synthetase
LVVRHRHTAINVDDNALVRQILHAVGNHFRRRTCAYGVKFFLASVSALGFFFKELVVRHIEAVTGTKAVEVAQKADRDINTINGLLKAQKDQTLEKVEALVDTASSLQKQIEQLNQKLASFQAAELLSQVQTLAGRQTLITTVQNMDAKSLRNLHDGVKSKLENAVIVLAGVEGDKVSLIASVAKDFTASIKAGDIIKHLATELGGKGGGKPDLAQGGAPLNEKFATVMADLTAWLEAK